MTMTGETAAGGSVVGGGVPGHGGGGGGLYCAHFMGCNVVECSHHTNTYIPNTIIHTPAPQIPPSPYPSIPMILLALTT